VAELMGAVGGTTLTVLGWAYKGSPPTDDMRGTPIAAMMPVFTTAGLRVLGHDPLVTNEAIRAYGGEPVSLLAGFRAADAVLIITDHPDYRNLDVAAALDGSNVQLIFDSWRILDADQIATCGVRYVGLGYEPAQTQPTIAMVSA
jgi:UDP-N-acetyl-D-mannosaminuronic acid dehydrogenase